MAVLFAPFCHKLPNWDFSMIPTTEANAFHGVPGCTYSIHRATIFQLDQGYGAGPPITYAQVGDKILHKWECVDRKPLVNSCPKSTA